MKVKLLTEAIAGKSIPKSRNNLQIPKNKLEKPELSNPSMYTVAIPNIHSSVVSENKQEESTQSNVTNTSTAATPSISTPESSTDFDVEKTSCLNKGKAENSESDKAKFKEKKLSPYFAKK